MEVNLKISTKNQFPLTGILIRGNSVRHWLLEIQRMQLLPANIKAYIVPGTTANSVFGLFISCHLPFDKTLIESNELCQQVSSKLFIPERSEIFPRMTKEETENLFSRAVWFMHPEAGLSEMTETLDLSKLIRLPEKSAVKVYRPHQSVFIPSEIRSFQIAPVKPEDILKKLEEETFPKRQKRENKPLSVFEKIKLRFYKQLFKKDKKTSEKPASPTQNQTSEIREKTAFGKFMDKLMKPFSGKKDDFSNRIQEDFDNLEERNKKEIDKLMEMLKNNPEEALKYAIPLDQGGSSRGSNNGRLKLSKNWSVFSVFANTSQQRSTGGGAVDIGDHYHELQRQYNQTAEELIRQKDYGKAAFVYMKLLKNERRAAETLENGEQFTDAASIYIKHLNDKSKAASCYEKGNLIVNAIDLYKEVSNNEKVGDMYTILNKRKEANDHYQIVADNFKRQNKYIQASLIYSDKMHENERAQSVLLEGWREEKDAVNCLKKYLSSAGGTESLKKELTNLYEKEVTNDNKEAFLQVLKSDDCKSAQLADQVKSMTYQIVADRAKFNPGIVRELRHFDPKNAGLVKDSMRFNIKLPKKNNRIN